MYLKIGLHESSAVPGPSQRTARHLRLACMRRRSWHFTTASHASTIVKSKYPYIPSFLPTSTQHSTMPPRINLPPITRGLLLTLLSLSALNAALRFRSWSASTPDNDTTAPSIYLTSPRWAIPYLVLIPTKSIVFPWTFLTSALIENNVVSLVISSAVVYFGGKYLERAWGGQEFIKFTLFVTMIPNIITFFIYAVWHGLTSHTPEQ